MMHTITLEMLQIVAEGIGHTTKLTPSRCSIATQPYEYCKELIRWKLYTPLNNTEQLLEIIRKLFILNYWIYKNELSNDYHVVNKNGERYTGNTLEESVCFAAFKIFEGVNNNV